jgi:AraC-like DNA-binding protein
MSRTGVLRAARFGDHAHMTREFQRWLGCAPGAMLACADVLAVAAASDNV